MTHRLLALLLALSAFSFVACNEEDPEDEGGGGTNLDAGSDYRNVGNVDLGTPNDTDTGADDADGGVIIDGEECTNLIDDDGDGDVDCGDEDCTGHEACGSTDIEVICDNGADDDGDGRADCNDTDCASQLVCQDDPDMGDDVVEGPEVCTGNLDEDGDDLIDCWDPDCDFDPACAATVAEDCYNSVDDDGDGLIDCDDTADCATACGGGGSGGSGDPICLFLCLLDPSGGGICSCGGGGGGAENCSNGIDDNGNGQIDCAELSCLIDPACM